MTSRQENARYLKDSSNILQTRPQTFPVPSTAKSSSNFGLSVSDNTPRAPKRIQDEPRKAPAVTRPPRVTTSQAPETTPQTPVTTRAPVTTRPPVLRAPSTPFPDRIQSIEPLFVSATENDEDNFIDDVFEAEMAKMQENGWVLPPSLMAVAAVPGAPVINQQVEAQRVPKGIPDSEVLGEMDPYLQFMPVPAVPVSSSDAQAPRQPKDSLNSFDINLNLANTVEAATPAPTPRRPAPQPLSTTSGPRSVAPTRAPTPRDEKRESRKQFKRCQGRCVQQFCLPVESISVYEGCVDKCKTFCT